MKKKLLFYVMCALLPAQNTFAQKKLYPEHFDLNEITLLDGPFKQAMDLNFKTLLSYDADRLLTPFVRQAGLSSTTDPTNPYYQWTAKHPSFTNWGDSSFNLEGHIGGHYLSALALAYAACHDISLKARIRSRLDSMIRVLKDCQNAYNNNTTGLYGFIGGQPLNSMWQDLYKGNTTSFNNNRGWVPFYCEHKILAGLRDAYIYGKNEDARELFHKLATWSVNIVSKLSNNAMQNILNTEQGGMNEVLLDAYHLFKDSLYLTAAKKYSHQTMIDGMQNVNTTFLDGKHANAQVAKYIGFERISEEDRTATQYGTAAANFWTDVATHRTVCIGGNSVSEHFLASSRSSQYIDNPDGPESCNSYNMLKLSEMLSDKTHDAKYADFYEHTMWNHILSTQDPKTGGYVYFTTLRPQGYHIYSQTNQAMWCCVGTGMENHSKYGHFIYTHEGDSILYINLFTPSKLEDNKFTITQKTTFPFSQQTKLIVGKKGNYTIAIRHPHWTTNKYFITVNSSRQSITVTKGTASYVKLHRNWSENDTITVNLPMELTYETCPNYTDYIAFNYGPILLGAQTTAIDQIQADSTGLKYEPLQNEFAGTGRMDHAPGSRALSKNLVTAPLLIGTRDTVLSRIKAKDLSKLTFTIDASRNNSSCYTWKTLELKPFYKLQHCRYMCYWYQQTPENYANSNMALTEAANEKLNKRTVDFIAPGEQQSEAGHKYSYSAASSTGTYNSETYRDTPAGGYIQYSLFNEEGIKDSLSILCRFTTADAGRKATLYVDGTPVANITIPSSAANSSHGFYNIEYGIPDSLETNRLGKAKKEFIVKLIANSTTISPGLYGLRLMSGYEDHSYKFIASQWTTGDTRRVGASKFSYDDNKNIITLTAPGTNNVCLMLNYSKCNYTISRSSKYLLVRAGNLLTTNGTSYLWWLNGINKGSQVAPTVCKTVNFGGDKEQIIAWNMATSGLYDNFSSIGLTDICQGQTIFGLTSSSSNGLAYIYDVNFVDNIDNYISATADIPKITTSNNKTVTPYFNLQGIRVKPSQKGVYIHNGKKVIL